MRLKTFLATYFLFLFILFSSIAIVSVYLNNSQITMLKDSGISQFQTIARSLSRDLSAAWERYTHLHGTFSVMADEITRGYALYYSRHSVYITLFDLTLLHSGQTFVSAATEASLIFHMERYFVSMSGTLAEPFEHFLLEYSLDITGNINTMRGIQNVLLISAVIFSIVAAFALYFVLSSIFKPLGIVAGASKEIADGRFNKRIPVKGDGELAQVAVDFNKMAEKIEEYINYLKDEAENKQQFVDNFAHEIRTPLTTIHGYAEYMQRAALDESEIIESSGLIIDESRQMRNLANSLLELATLRKYAPVLGEIAVDKLFFDVSQTMERHLNEKNTRLVCLSEVEFIIGQEDLIRSLLVNLCTNANNACVSGGEIQMEAVRRHGGVTLVVRDNGCGIPSEGLGKITEPFFRVDKSRNRKDGGAGLGLALCKQIAEAHGARMGIDSVVGEGTVVEVIFTSS